MNKMKNGKGSRGRSGATHRGGIQKRGPTRIDRDGDMEMDATGARNRGKKGRSDAGRLAGGRASAADAIQKAISGTTDSQVNIRQTGKGNLEQVSVRGWKQSKAASNRDGGHESLITFLEKKLNTSDSKAGSRARITKVCATSELAVTDMNLRLGPLRCVPLFKDGTPKRRSTIPGFPCACSFG